MVACCHEYLRRSLTQKARLPRASSAIRVTSVGAVSQSIYFNTVLIATLDERDYIIRG
jgi:7,8-dihydro-6-hydroxymethylpterin-pyrophosphokinase